MCDVPDTNESDFQDAVDKHYSLLVEKKILTESENRWNQDRFVIGQKLNEITLFEQEQTKIDIYCHENRPESYSEATWKRLSSKIKLIILKSQQYKLSQNAVKIHREIQKRKKNLQKNVKNYFKTTF